MKNTFGLPVRMCYISTCSSIQLRCSQAQSSVAIVFRQFRSLVLLCLKLLYVRRRKCTRLHNLYDDPTLCFLPFNACRRRMYTQDSPQQAFALGHTANIYFHWEEHAEAKTTLRQEGQVINTAAGEKHSSTLIYQGCGRVG